MNTDIMIDLETLDVLPTATILTIGAVKFDPFGDDINEKKAEKFYVRVDVDSCDALGGTVSQSTLWHNFISSAGVPSVFGVTVQDLIFRSASTITEKQAKLFLGNSGNHDALEHCLTSALIPIDPLY